ncbi:response regulator [Algoriphagus sp.]|uniref:response regulator n=1 Tax=Algoriphagus sp. TaxID=1872435 RepID=UPI0025F2A987|nr:response regulator [Algoriphagus sp.]
MSKTILIVDDSESIREIMNYTLENAEYNVLVGNDGEHAQSFLDGTPINLIITDLNMPKKNGIELIKEIRQKEDYKYTPILVLTTESQVSKKQEAKEAGATGWIVKPFVTDKLLSVVQKVIR